MADEHDDYADADAIGPTSDDHEPGDYSSEPEIEIDVKDAVGPTGDEDADARMRTTESDVAESMPETETPPPAGPPASEVPVDFDALARQMLGIEPPTQTAATTTAAAPQARTYSEADFEAEVARRVAAQQQQANPPAPRPAVPTAQDPFAKAQTEAFQRTQTTYGPRPDADTHGDYAVAMWDRVYAVNYQQAHQQALQEHVSGNLQQQALPLYQEVYGALAEARAVRMCPPNTPEPVIREVAQATFDEMVRRQSREVPEEAIRRHYEGAALRFKQQQAHNVAIALRQNPAVAAAVAKALAQDRKANARPALSTSSQSSSTKSRPTPKRGDRLSAVIEAALAPQSADQLH